jgi:hypothetical protein
MPEVCLRRNEAEAPDLPAICMRCGAPASHRELKQFTWRPHGVFIRDVRMQVLIPFCEHHVGHWRTRRRWIWGWFGGLILSLSLAFLVSFLISNQLLSEELVFGTQMVGSLFLCCGFPLSLIGWSVSVFVADFTSIRPTEITWASITLTGVHVEFVNALDWYRRYDREELKRSFDSSRPDDENFDSNLPR